MDADRSLPALWGLRPLRAEAGLDDVPLGLDTLAYEAVAPEPVPDLSGLQSDPERDFRQGYRDHGGNPAWEDHVIYDVILGCEHKSGWEWLGGNEYLSIAQFHPDTWARVASATGLDDPTNLYHVGANVAYWSNRVDPGSTAGWPVCWWKGW